MQWVLGVLVALVVLWFIARYILGVLARMQDPVYMVDPDDPAMQEATRTAQQTLPFFWRQMQNPDENESMFSVKVRLEDGDLAEHFWLAEVEPVGDMVRGKLDNVPNIVRNYKDGQEVTVPNTEISDWMFMRDEKIVGNFTLRTQLNKFPEEKQAEMSAMLAENPPLEA
jgi:uncharacterized protein YegJ (DUF2314 family)